MLLGLGLYIADYVQPLSNERQVKNYTTYKDTSIPRCEPIFCRKILSVLTAVSANAVPAITISSAGYVAGCATFLVVATVCAGDRRGARWGVF